MNTELLTGNQKHALRIAKQEYLYYIRGLTNTLEDMPEDSEEYQFALQDLNHPRLADFVYAQVVLAASNGRVISKHIRFAGKKFVIEQIQKWIDNDRANGWN